MSKTHGQGRLGAVECASQRAHARRLLLTLAEVCRRLQRLQKNPAARAACQQVERDLLWLQDHARKQIPVRSSKQREL